MKALVIILISTFISVCSIQAQENGSMTICSDTEREIPLKDLQPDKPINRSIILQFAYAYLYNKVITVSFEEVMPTVTIKITQESTGETVYSQDYMSPSAVTIDLNSMSAGTYRIEIATDDSCLEGEFML